MNVWIMLVTASTSIEPFPTLDLLKKHIKRRASYVVLFNDTQSCLLRQSAAILKRVIVLGSLRNRTKNSVTAATCEDVSPGDIAYVLLVVQHSFVSSSINVELSPTTKLELNVSSNFFFLSLSTRPSRDLSYLFESPFPSSRELPVSASGRRY